MDRFHLMNVFVAVAEEQGFAAAARRLNLSPPAVTRAVAALEQQLGIELLHRTTRYVRVTEAGVRYLDDIRRILSELQAAEEAATGVNAQPRGHLSITAPVLFGRKYVMPGIVAYLDQYPETEVSAIFLDRVVNLLEEGLDVGIRIGELPDSSMRALRVGTINIVTCASPEYLDLHGIPQHPDDLQGHSIVASIAGNQAINWQFHTHKGKHALRLRPRLSVTTNDGAIEAVLQNFGITRLLSYQIADQLESGKLATILEKFQPKPWPIHIVHREGRLSSTKVRAFIDFLAEHLRNEKALNPDCP